jgi:hypothetical protein
MDIHNINVFNMKEVDNYVNLAAGRIINCRTHYILLCRDKNKH